MHLTQRWRQIHNFDKHFHVQTEYRQDVVRSLPALPWQGVACGWVDVHFGQWVCWPVRVQANTQDKTSQLHTENNSDKTDKKTDFYSGNLAIPAMF